MSKLICTYVFDGTTFFGCGSNCILDINKPEKIEYMYLDKRMGNVIQRAGFSY